MMEHGKPRSNEEWVNYPDGRQVLLDTIKAPLYDANGILVGLLGVGKRYYQKKNTRKSNSKISI